MIELTIKRTNGEIEKVQREGGMTETLFTKMQEATRNAGKGEIMSWEQVDIRTEEEKAEQANHAAKIKAAGYCPKCESFCYGDCQAQ